MKLCLVMIVKDAGEEILPVLRSIKPYLSCYCISDTGSLDDTPQRIRTELSDLPGTVYEDGWFDFGTNRNIVISHAEADYPCDFYLMLDDSYVLTEGNPLEQISQLDPRVSANYLVRIIDKEKSYFSGRLFTKGQRYIYRIHEAFEQPAAGALHLVFQDNVSANHLHRSKRRFHRDLHYLALDEADRPTDPRPVYYTARTYYAMENNGKAAEYFKRRTELPVNAENLYELYNSYFYLSIIAYKKFVLTRDYTDCNACIERFQLCSRLFPHRAEPLYHLATIMTYFYFETRQDEILSLLEKAITIPIPDDNDVFYEVYTDKIPYRLAFHYYRTQQYEKSLKVISTHRKESNTDLRYDNLLIAMDALPKKSVEHHPEETIVIYATDVVNIPWNGAHFNELCSGSEYMAVRLAEFFVNRGKRVYIFCVCDGLEGEVNGVYYLPVQQYYRFLRNTWVDLLIVSRDSGKLSYLPNIRNVFLWIHDTEPIGDEFQTSPTFRAAVVLTESHKKHIMRTFQLNDKLLQIIPNAIQPLSPQREKKSLQFIYASSPDRGLDFLLPVFRVICKKYPAARLLIFANKSLVSAQALQQIDEDPDHITLSPRVSREVLHGHYAESDYWLYPTDFVETYCITAAEAQYYRCVCIYSAVGALIDTVGARGVMLKKRVSDPEYDQEIVQKIDFLEQNPNMKEVYRHRGHDWAKEQMIENIGMQWQKFIVA